MNVSELSLDELLALQSEVKQGIEKQKDSAILSIVETMKAIGIGIDEVAKFHTVPVASVKTGKGGYTRKPKYRNPLDPSLTWGGVGKMPRWFTAQLDKGVDKESMLIPT
ncbi:MAG: H-NS histone family protein [Streptococcus sp.]|nr:H-NS histone family protein [Streptococcus sp.]